MKDGKVLNLRSPKRNGTCDVERANWYPYYAGYSPQFVEDSIEFARTLGTVSSILDPWNGSGTTTQVARSQQVCSEGFDLNPAMVLVAKAKTLHSNVQASVPSLLDDICLKARELRVALPDDPLGVWLNKRTTGIVRSVDKAIFMLLVNRAEYRSIGKLESFAEVSALASFFYLALFRALRTFLKPFVGSNPTWIRRPGVDDLLLNIPSTEVISLFRRNVLFLHASLVSEAEKNSEVSSVTTRVDVASSESLPLNDAAIDLVISSPPYCTRIDYAVKTSPELAILGIDQQTFRTLRNGMIGTPTIADTPDGASRGWGASCEHILRCISHHTARASKSYYWKTYAQYFDGLFESVKEISRVLRPGGLSFIVVQDSFYKELHVDLAGIVTEMATGLGFQQIDRCDFKASRTMVGLHTTSRTYNNAQAHTESILVWKKSRQNATESSNGRV